LLAARLVNKKMKIKNTAVTAKAGVTVTGAGKVSG
jgi:hypothetical protein